MPHAHGTYLGSIRSIADVRLRCVAADDGECWHLRTAHGKPQAKGGRVQRIWVHGRGSVSVTRAVWELAHGRPMPRGRRGVRMCRTYDCANPAHIRALTHSDAQRVIIGSAATMSPRRKLQLMLVQRSRRKLTADQLHEIRHSEVSAAALARRWQISPTTINAVRNGVTYRDELAP